MTRTDLGAKHVRALGYVAASLAVLLALSVSLTWFASGIADSSRWRYTYALNALTSPIANQGLSAATLPDLQAIAAELSERPGWRAVVVVNPAGEIVAAVPKTALGLTLPLRGNPRPVLEGTWIDVWSGTESPLQDAPRPVLEVWANGRPTDFGRLLGLSEGPDDYYVAGVGVHSRDAAGQTALTAWVWAVAAAPRFLGLTADEWSPPLISLSLALYILGALTLALWVFADARRRAMDAPWAWGALTLVTTAVGWATYLITRSWQRPQCPNCGGSLRPSFKTCPHCGNQVKRACPSCGQGVEHGWNFCPHCSAGLN
jgi:hypothetical protein